MFDDIPNLPKRYMYPVKIGQGTFSVILKATDIKNGKEIAIKVERINKGRSIIEYEYKILRFLQLHPQVPKVYEFISGSKGSPNMIIMDLLGPNLAKKKKEHGDQGFPREIAAKYLIDSLKAIKITHSYGFVHRDIKATNFVVNPITDVVFLVDFGLAKRHFKED